MPRITSRSKAARFAICLSRENCRIYFGEWVAFLESVKGVRLGGVDFAGSQLIFLAGTARLLATRRSTPASSSPVGARGAAILRSFAALGGAPYLLA